MAGETRPEARDRGLHVLDETGERAWAMGAACMRLRRAAHAWAQSWGPPSLSPLSLLPQIYNTEKLRLALVGPQVRGQPSRRRNAVLAAAAATAVSCRNSPRLRMPPHTFMMLQLKHKISALACKGDLTFAAVRGTIVECRRVHRSGEYRGHAADILQLLVLGDRLLSLGRDGRLLVWRIGQYAAPEVAIQLARCGGQTPPVTSHLPACLPASHPGLPRSCGPPPPLPPAHPSLQRLHPHLPGPPRHIPEQGGGGGRGGAAAALELCYRHHAVRV